MGAAYDPEHLRRRGLLLQRFAQIVSALTQFVQQPRVLDGDYRLRGKVLHQLNLFIREGPNFLTKDGDGTDQFATFKHRHHNERSYAKQLDTHYPQRIAFSIKLSCRNVGNMRKLFCRCDATKGCSWSWSKDGFAFKVCWWRVVVGSP